MEIERLTQTAIRREGEEHHSFKSHADLRRALGDTNPYVSKRSDEEGFWTSAERFVTRREAVEIGILAGQLTGAWRDSGRQLLSSDINWKAGAVAMEGAPAKPTFAGESRQVRRQKERDYHKNLNKGVLRFVR
jgi:hypothetical protein